MKRKIDIIIQKVNGIFQRYKVLRKNLERYDKFKITKELRKLQKILKRKRFYYVLRKFFYRNMVVYNFSAKDNQDYPLLGEFRATFISSKQIKVIRKLNATAKNMADYLSRFGRAERMNKIKLTIGQEINKKISAGEVGKIINYCDKYMRIVNKGGEYVYQNEDVENICKKIPYKNYVFITPDGFIFRISGLEKYIQMLPTKSEVKNEQTKN